MGRKRMPLTNSELGHAECNHLPSAERLRELFIYEEHTGHFIRRLTVRNRWMAGEVAGCKSHPRGYLAIRVDAKRYFAHRLVWKYVYGVDPKIYVDHINGDPSDNRLCNLREADTCENIANSRKRVTQRFPKGVSEVRQKCGVAYTSQICSRGDRLFIGNFKTPEAAQAAYLAKQAEIHGKFANPG